MKGNFRQSVLRRIYDWLATTDPPGVDDLIFVLAGREERKRHGLKLYRDGRAPRLLLSVARFEIRRFRNLDLPQALDLQEIALRVPAPLRHFFLCFDGQRWQVERIPRGRFGTLSEISALKHWLAGHPEIASMALITSGAHLRRVRMCCRALLPSGLRLRLIAVPVGPPELDGKDAAHPEISFEFVFSELIKLVGYRAILASGAARRRVG